MSLLNSATLVLDANLDLIPPAGQALAWSSASHDSAAFFNSASPTLLTIPEGFTRAQLVVNATVAQSSAGLLDTGVEFFVEIQKNGTSGYSERASQSGVASVGTAQVRLSAISPVLEVAAGDTFNVFVRSNGSSDFALKANGTSFSIQAD